MLANFALKMNYRSLMKKYTKDILMKIIEYGTKEIPKHIQISCISHDIIHIYRS